MSEAADIPSWFWELLGPEDGRAGLRQRLERVEKARLIAFQRTFEDASQDLLTEETTEELSRLGIESEDALEDFAHSVVSRGRDYYHRVASGHSPRPSIEDFNETVNLAYVASEVFRERFHENLYDYVDVDTDDDEQ